MRHTIRRQMMFAFTGLLAFIIVLILVINHFFLAPYYLKNKEHQFVEFYEGVMDAYEDDNLTVDSFPESLEHTAEKANISYLVIGSQDQEMVTNVYDNMMMMNQMFFYFMETQNSDTSDDSSDSENTDDSSDAQSQDDSDSDEDSSKPDDKPGAHEIDGNNDFSYGEVLKSTDDYILFKTTDNKGTKYIEMIGALDDGRTFLFRSPLESIADAAQITNTFFLYIAVGMLIVVLALSGYFSKKISDPINELAKLSKRMADMEFNVKYSGGGAQEIRELGENFNEMSWKLEKAIAELKTANFNLQKDLEKKEKLEQMRTEFLGNVSHELKTPIALIQGYAEGLKEGIVDDPESREFYCDVIMDEAGKMNHMVKNLLTLNQLEVGNQNVVFERFDLTELISGVLQNLEILGQDVHPTVVFKQTEPVYVWADEFMAEQVVRNYVSNAYHHVSGDMIIEVKITHNEGKAHVSVFNTGTPIPDDSLEHLWEKFYKVDKAHTREYGGNGIGLSIVKAIMNSFHQDFGVKNYENGVEFWFELDEKATND